MPLSAAAAGREVGSNESNYASEREVEKLDSVVVAASRAQSTTPVVFTMVGKDEMRKNNPINSLPMMLSLQPSVISMNEGGTGLGASDLTIRGSQGSQINVTFNGITLNDAESQQVFWVNIPSLSGILSSVQVQRGLGTTANGTGAFGASINMSTSSVASEPWASVDLAGGSFNTFTATAGAGTGLTKHGLYFDIIYSKNFTDGYIRNAKVRSQSLFATMGWMNENNSLKLSYLLGDQHTGITWNGISLEQFEEDPTYNETGAFLDEFGNTRYYDNDTDNYTQHHLQLNYTHLFNNGLVWSTTYNFTKGDGYYQNYKADKKFKKYGWFEDFEFDVDGDPATPAEMFTPKDKSDFIVKKVMDNYYHVLNSELKYSNEKVDFVGGVNLSRYDGGHFGRVLWNSSLKENYNYDDHFWYRNDAYKNEIGVFARAEWHPLTWLTSYLDLQYRGIYYKMWGLEDEDKINLAHKDTWHFFNPRYGLSFQWNPYNKAYCSVAMGNREPTRTDIKMNSAANINNDNPHMIKPEMMVDVEYGYEFRNRVVAASVNFYNMEYFDMLLESGKLTNTGRPVKENTGRAWRRGVELAASYKPCKWFSFDGNYTFSVNQIENYIDHVSMIDNVNDWNELGMTQDIDYGKTTMLMSPSHIGMVQVAFTPFASISHNSLKTTTLAINGKFVGKQFMDNTGRDEMAMPWYYTLNLSLSHEFKLKAGSLGLAAYVNNFTNNKYYAKGAVWKTWVESENKEIFSTSVYPQAPVNAMLKVSYRF